MLYSYAGVTEKGFALFEKRIASLPTTAPSLSNGSDRGEGINNVSPDAASMLESTPSDQDASIRPQDVTLKASLNQKGLNDYEVGAPPNAILPADASPRSDAHVPVDDHRQLARLKINTMSNLSIVLTLISILVAFTCVSLGKHCFKHIDQY